MKTSKKINNILFKSLLSSLLVGISITAILQNNKTELHNNFLANYESNHRSNKKSYLVKLAQGSDAYHSGAIWYNGVTNKNELYMWGYNGYGEIGDGTTSNAWKPKKIDVIPTTNSESVVEVALGFKHSAAIVENNGKKELYTWGLDDKGQLGRDNDAKKPGKVDLSGNVIDVSLGDSHSGAIVENNGKKELYTWGFNSNGQLGLGDRSDKHTPNKVAAISENVISLGFGSVQSSAIVENNKTKQLYTWGKNNYGQLGHSNTTDQSTPKKVESLSGNISEVAFGFRHIAAIVDNKLYTWGRNNYGQLGRSGDIKNPVQVTSIHGVVKHISLGASHSSAIVDDNGINELYTWGWNKYGQLGNGEPVGNSGYSTPKKVLSISKNAIDSSLGNGHSIAIVDNNANKELYTWGDNSQGQLGRGGETQNPRFADVLNISAYTIDTLSLDGLYYFEIAKKLLDQTDQTFKNSIIKFNAASNVETKILDVSLNNVKDKIIIKWQVKNVAYVSPNSGNTSYNVSSFDDVKNIEIPIKSITNFKLGSPVSLKNNEAVVIEPMTKLPNEVVDTDLTDDIKASINAKINGILSPAVAGYDQTISYIVDSANANNENKTIPIRVSIKGSIDETTYLWDANKITPLTINLQFKKETVGVGGWFVPVISTILILALLIIIIAIYSIVKKRKISKL